MLKLFFADLKMITRNFQTLFWSLFFPLMFTIIFGFFFGGTNQKVGTIAIINQNQTNSQLTDGLIKTLNNANVFKVQNETDINHSKDLVKNGKIFAIVDIPDGFGNPTPDSPKQIKIIEDPANAQANQVLLSVMNSFLTQTNFSIQNAKPIYSLDEEKTTNKTLTYFDFVLVGLIGLALMNSSIQGIAIPISKYREDKILKRITTTPLPSWKFVSAEVLSRLVINVIQISLIFTIGIYFFHAHIYGSIPLIFAIALFGGLLFQTIGFAVAAASKTTDAAQGMSVAITIPMMFLAGVFFPIDQLPRWLYSIVQYLPLAPLLRMIRQVALEQLSPFTNPYNVLIVIGWIIVMLFISIRKFKLSDE